MEGVLDRGARVSFTRATGEAISAAPDPKVARKRSRTRRGGDRGVRGSVFPLGERLTSARPGGRRSRGGSGLVKRSGPRVARGASRDAVRSMAGAGALSVGENGRSRQDASRPGLGSHRKVRRNARAQPATIPPDADVSRGLTAGERVREGPVGSNRSREIFGLRARARGGLARRKALRVAASSNRNRDGERQSWSRGCNGGVPQGSTPPAVQRREPAGWCLRGDTRRQRSDSCRQRLFQPCGARGVRTRHRKVPASVRRRGVDRSGRRRKQRPLPVSASANCAGAKGRQSLPKVKMRGLARSVIAKSVAGVKSSRRLWRTPRSSKLPQRRSGDRKSVV